MLTLTLEEKYDLMKYHYRRMKHEFGELKREVVALCQDYNGDAGDEWD